MRGFFDWAMLVALGSALLLGESCARPREIGSVSASTGGGTGMPGEGGAGNVIVIGGAPGMDDGTGPQSCAEAENAKSYIGCEYWIAPAPYRDLEHVTASPDDFTFAVAAANETEEDATIWLERDGVQLANTTVPAGEIGVIAIPWNHEIRLGFTNIEEEPRSGIARIGAYRLTSTVPVSVYQFDPLEYREDNAGDVTQSNAASLLLPAHALGTEYHALTWSSAVRYQEGMLVETEPTFVSVTATTDSTTVEVSSPARLRAGTDIEASEPGEAQSFELDRGDVLVLFTGIPGTRDDEGCPTNGWCMLGPDGDITGTRVRSDKPVGVMAGGGVAVPDFDAGHDHTEEMMPPTETLGTELVATTPALLSGGEGPFYLRVLSASDDNVVTVEPAEAQVDSFTLQAGEWRELGPLSESVVVRGTGRLQVGQFLPGNHFVREQTGQSVGDPSKAIATPTEQFRMRYPFLTSPTFASNYVNVIAEMESDIVLDEARIPSTAFQRIGDSRWGVARVTVEGSKHLVTGTKRFGIVVYGYAELASYMYAGGLDLKGLTIVPR